MLDKDVDFVRIIRNVYIYKREFVMTIPYAVEDKRTAGPKAGQLFTGKFLCLRM